MKARFPLLVHEYCRQSNKREEKKEDRERPSVVFGYHPSPNSISFLREMFGRVRPSSSTPLETPPSKILKDDSLSIYEATLMKLKQASQRDLSLPVEDMETDCSAANVSTTSTETIPVHPTHPSSEAITIDDSDCSSKPSGSREISVLYLFSRYNNSQQHLLSSSSTEETVTNGSATASPISTSNCQSVGTTKQLHEHECFSSTSVCLL